MAGDRAMRAGKWERLLGSSIVGKTLGLVGCGGIARRTAGLALGLGMSVAAFDPHRDQLVGLVRELASAQEAAVDAGSRGPDESLSQELLDEHVGELPVSVVIYSHSHIDHFAGVRALVTDEDIAAGRVEIIAPRDFMDFAVAENVYAGNVMTRRSMLQYGTLLQPSPYGHAGQGLGQISIFLVIIVA